MSEIRSQATPARDELAFMCRQLFNVFGVRSIPNKQQCERWCNLCGAMPA